jgi:spore coat protein U-like protein
VRCSNGTPYTVLLSTGAGTYAQRLLSMGTDTLEYNLFTASDLGTIWGDGVGNGTVGGVGTGLSSSEEKIHTVYGELANSAANQDAPVGSYTDSITVTIVY